MRHDTAMVRASRSALALGIVVLAAASSTAAGSGSPVIEAGGARPVPDPRWLARASTYDTACSAPDADPAEYVHRIAMHVDDSVAARRTPRTRRACWRRS